MKIFNWISIHIGVSICIANILLTIAMPLIMRLYSPEEIGTMAILIAFTNIASVAICLRFDMAIINSKSDEESNYLLMIATILSIPCGIIFGIILFLLTTFNILNYGVLPWWSSLIATPLLILSGIFYVARLWLTRMHKYSDISVAIISQGIARSCFPIALSPLHLGWLGLAIGELSSRTVGVRKIFKEPMIALKEMKSNFKQDKLKIIIKSYKRFPLVILPSSLIDVMASMFPISMFAWGYGSSAAGYYFAVTQIIFLPTSVLAAAFADILHVRITTMMLNREQVIKFFWQVTTGLFIISIVIYGPLFLFGPHISIGLLGHQWVKAGRWIRVFSPAGVFIMVASPLSRFLIATNRSKTKLIFDVIHFIVPFTGIVLPYYFKYDLESTVRIFCIQFAAAYCMYFFIIRWAIEKPKFI